MLLGNYMVCAIGLLLSASSLVLSWPELELDYKENSLVQKYEDKKVSISGFLYCKDEKVFLCAEPGLRTCCVGKGEKAYSQILLNELQAESYSLGQLVTVEGNYHTEVTENELGESQQCLVLDNAVFLENSRSSFVYGSVVFGTICALFALATRYTNRG